MVRIDVYYKKGAFKYCPKCLHCNYFKNIKTKNDKIYGYCQHCRNDVELITEIEVIKIKLNKTLYAPILFFQDIKDRVNFILKPYKKGFKKWFIDKSYKEFLGYYSKYRFGSYEKIITLDNYIIKEMTPKIENIYLGTHLPLVYFNELNEYELNFIKEKEIK